MLGFELVVFGDRVTRDANLPPPSVGIEKSGAALPSIKVSVIKMSFQIYLYTAQPGFGSKPA